jgi:hypothetical protein
LSDAVLLRSHVPFQHFFNSYPLVYLFTLLPFINQSAEKALPPWHHLDLRCHQAAAAAAADDER